MTSAISKNRFLSKFFGDKAFYKSVIKVVLPIFIQNLITTFVGLLDNVMIGSLGTEEMSGVAISNQVVFTFNLLVFGFVSGVGIFLAQYYGKKDYEGMKNAFRFSLLCGLAVTALSVPLVFFLRGDLTNLFLSASGSVEGDPLKVLAFGKDYLKIIVISFPAFIFSQVIANALSSAKKTSIPMISGIIAVVVNLILNYILIFGKLGAPKLGVVGAAIATVVARYVELIFLIIWVLCNKKKCPYFKGIFKNFRIPQKEAFAIIKKGTPLMLNEFLWGLGTTMIVWCYSMRGLAAIAAFNIANTLGNFFNSGMLAFGNAVGIIVGNVLGSGASEKEVMDVDIKLLTFATLFCTVLGALLAAVSKFFPLIYNTTDLVRDMATRILFILAGFMPLSALFNAVYFTIRAGGKTVVTFLFDSTFNWAIYFPLALCLVKFTTLDVVFVFLIITSLDIIKTGIGFILLKTGKWRVSFVKDLSQIQKESEETTEYTATTTEETSKEERKNLGENNAVEE